MPDRTNTTTVGYDVISAFSCTFSPAFATTPCTEVDTGALNAYGSWAGAERQGVFQASLTAVP